MSNMEEYTQVENDTESILKSDEVENLLSSIDHHDAIFLDHFKDVLEINDNLDRTIVSFQANKKEPFYRWYKFKEAFSSRLLKYLIQNNNVEKGIILDPFAGIGTTMFTVSKLGYDTEGIELLPIGAKIIKSRADAATSATKEDIAQLIFWRDQRPWEYSKTSQPINNLRITKKAYSRETELSIGKYLSKLNEEKNLVKELLLTSLLSVLESISFTRKDGQYLRWDYRSGRSRGSNTFNKGKVFGFKEAITLKLDEIIQDIEGHDEQLSFIDDDGINEGTIKLYRGSCLNILPEIENGKYSAIITSPPYCNRYDYTRTYALELAMLGVTENNLLNLRQEMLSCTVENREKDLLRINKNWELAINSCDKNNLLQSILVFLETKKKLKQLNNSGIPRMVRGYFYEMACVIQECYRVLKNDGILFMVNDNVRYAGASISVDLILSKIAEDIGFTIKKIFVLPNGKGNSSQQMGVHGRQPLRKCVYIWSKNSE